MTKHVTLILLLISLLVDRIESFLSAASANAHCNSKTNNQNSNRNDYNGRMIAETKLGMILSWFSNDDESKQGSEDRISSKGRSTSNLGGVSGIMDSMENFRTSQQVGKMTSALVAELSSMTFEGSSAEGKIKVFFDGQQRPLSVQVDEAYLENVDISDFVNAMTAAMKDGYSKSADRMDEKMKTFYQELGLPQSKN